MILLFLAQDLDSNKAAKARLLAAPSPVIPVGPVTLPVLAPFRNKIRQPARPTNFAFADQLPAVRAQFEVNWSNTTFDVPNTHDEAFYQLHCFSLVQQFKAQYQQLRSIYIIQ